MNQANVLARFDALALALACALAAWRPAVARAADLAPWNGVPVLMYHRVDAEVPRDAVGRDLTVEPAAFEAQLRYLRARHIITITAAQLADALRRGRRPRHSVVLTFDDGYADAATVAVPLLEKYRAHGTFYVSSGFVGTPRHLTWRQMRAMRAAGMEVACHGTEHLDLSTLDAAGQTREAGGCVKRFARYLGGPPTLTYAYPAGKYDATTLALMRALGMRAAFTEVPGNVTSLGRPFELPRKRIRHDDDLAHFAAVVAP